MSSPSPLFGMGSLRDPRLSGSSPDFNYATLPLAGSGSYSPHTPHAGSFHNSNHLQPSHVGNLNVEQLEIHDLLKNHHVITLYNNLNNATATILETTQQNNRLLQEIAVLKGNVKTNDYFDNGSRPENYPESILWLESDCRNDPDVKIGVNNPSRIPMNAAIRHKDGRIIESGLYDAIRASGGIIIHRDLLTLPPAPDKRAAKAPRTRSYFKTWFPKEWIAALMEFERQQPLLALCASSWKADRVLGGLLNSMNQSQKYHQGHHSVRSRRNGINTTSNTSEDVPETPQVHDNTFDNSSTSGPTLPSSTPSSAVQGISNQPPNQLKRSLPLSQPDSNVITAKEDPHTLKKAKLSVSSQRTQTTTFSNSTLLNLNNLTESVSLDQAQENSNGVNVGFIAVRPTFDNLQDIFQQNYPHLPIAMELLNAMKAYPEFHRQDPSNTMMEFLTRIELANPNDALYDEDNSGPGWGHYQFTSGSLSCGTVITSWAEVGNTDIACRLIAASVRTAKVARYVCEEKQIVATSFIADTYIERVVESLWTVWKSTPGAPPSASELHDISSSSTLPEIPVVNAAPRSSSTLTTATPAPVAPEFSTTVVAAPAAGNKTGAKQGADDVAYKGTVRSTEDILKLFQNKELKAWALLRNAKLEGPPNKQRTNKEFIAAIMNDIDCLKPSEVDLATILAARVPKKKKSIQQTQ